jgi:uncharacterized protein (TIGR02597 family)
MDRSHRNAGTLIAILLHLAAAPFEARAADGVTDPMGYTEVALAGNSDSYLFVPFKRTPALVATVAAIGANGQYDEGEPFVDTDADGQRDASESFTDTSNVLTLPEEVVLQQGQFVYTEGTQPNSYYVSFKSGSKEGIFCPVVGNGVNSVVVDAMGYDLSAMTGELAIEVVPYHTLGTVFPNGQGIHPSASHSDTARPTSVLLPNHEVAGKNLPYAQIYYYYSGTEPGWRKSDAPDVVANDTALPPDSFFIVRHNHPTGTTLVFAGDVHVAKFATPLNTLAANVDQDNFVAAPIPVEMRLRDLNLVESGAFVPSSSHSLAVRQDTLLVWYNTALGFNRAATVGYYYFSGTSGAGPGWRKSGAPNVLADDDVVMSSSRVFVIRKKATPVVSSSLWSVTPPYLPLETP